MVKLPLVIHTDLPESVAYEFAANPEKIFSAQKNTTVEKTEKDSWVVYDFGK